MSDPRTGGRTALRRFALPLALLVFGLPAGLTLVMMIGKLIAIWDEARHIDRVDRAATGEAA